MKTKQTMIATVLALGTAMTLTGCGGSIYDQASAEYESARQEALKYAQPLREVSEECKKGVSPEFDEGRPCSQVQLDLASVDSPAKEIDESKLPEFEVKSRIHEMDKDIEKFKNAKTTYAQHAAAAREALDKSKAKTLDFVKESLANSDAAIDEAEAMAGQVAGKVPQGRIDELTRGIAKLKKQREELDKRKDTAAWQDLIQPANDLNATRMGLENDTRNVGTEARGRWHL